MKPYKTELHCHTKSVSACAWDEPEHLIGTYLREGYDAIVVTDHLNDYTFWNMAKIARKERGCRYLPEGFDMSILDRSEAGTATWDDKVDFLLAGPAFLRQIAGDRIRILLGAEIRLWDSDNDYLLYGLTEDFLRSHPDLNQKKLREVSRICRDAGVLLVQAHPFRVGSRIMHPSFLDGAEVFNGANSENSNNRVAALWAETYGLIPTSGSDYHFATHEACGGIRTDTPVTSEKQLAEVLRSGSYELVRGREATATPTRGEAF